METLYLKNRKEQKIIGDLEEPRGVIKGTCVCQHGWGSHRNNNTTQTVKNAFLKEDIQTFNFDTTNAMGESDGDFEESTLGLHTEDLHDVVRWVQKQSWFVGPLYLSGHSKGGFAVLDYAENYPGEIEGVIAVAPVVSGKLSFQSMKKFNKEKLDILCRDGKFVYVNDKGVTKVNHLFQYEERLNHNLLSKAGLLTMPVLLIVGSQDTSCPLEDQQILYDALPPSSRNLVIIEGAPHSFDQETNMNLCAQAIKNWLVPLLS